ncbi:acyl-CoA thioesterase [Agromyces seonyuensis]|uniref:Thioesterase n=1 Tax=Agromyces seonyuensis TaxID=2662446 RepID=A0A6I4NS04_9MICO|nr:thioesterase family protein [Agromyces seonyuensis]MWB97206.1 thioesterase [Agromyces seonyuensis]
MNLYLRLLLLRLNAERRGRLGVWDTSRTPFRVVPTDLDLLGHMNNGKYLTIMDVARMDLMIRSGFWKRLEDAGWYPVVAGQTIAYRKSLQPWQRFDVYTRILGFDERWGYLEQTFVVGSTVYAQAIVRSRFLKKSGGSVDHDELFALAGEHPAHLELPEWLDEWTANAVIPKEYVSARVE